MKAYCHICGKPCGPHPGGNAKVYHVKCLEKKLDSRKINLDKIRAAVLYWEKSETIKRLYLN